MTSIRPLLLLHGALGSANQLEPLRQKLAENRPVHALNFSGHGGLPMPSEPFSLQLFGKAIAAEVTALGWDEFEIFGYSMGGYVALWLAAGGLDGQGFSKNSIQKITTLGTKLDWNPATAAKEISMLNPEKMAEKIPAFAALLAERHAPTDWKSVVSATAAFLQTLGDEPLRASDFSKIQCPVRLCVGELDNMVSVAETEDVAGQIPDAQFEVLPGVKHAIEQLDLAILPKIFA